MNMMNVLADCSLKEELRELVYYYFTFTTREIGDSDLVLDKFFSSSSEFRRR